MLLDIYPEAKNIIIEWLEANLAKFYFESVSNFVREELASKLYQETNDCRLTFKEFEKLVNLSNFGVSTAHRYTTLFGYKYSARKKSYYSDKHESEENVRDRHDFIKKYHEYKQDAYLWVQISEEQAVELEQTHGLLLNTAAFCYEGMRASGDIRPETPKLPAKNHIWPG